MKLKITLFVLMLLSLSFVNAQTENKNFSFQIGTGFGFKGLQRVNGGAFDGSDVTLFGITPIYDFKVSSLFFAVGGSVRFKHFEWDIEFEKVNFESNVIYQLNRRKEAQLNFTNFNIAVKYYPFLEPLKGFQPYIKGYLYNVIYTDHQQDTPDITNPNSTPIEESNVGYSPLLGLSLGTDYMFNQHFGAYLQFGYGFEFCQFGGVYKL
ncbi:MAG: hypothetical protein ACOYO1_03640 [Bacteroidales bacterium]